MDAGLRGRHRDRRGLRDCGRRAAQSAVHPGDCRPVHLYRHAVSFGAVEPCRGSRRQAYCRDRQRRERGPVRAADRTARVEADDFPALGQLAHAAQGPPLCTAHAAIAHAVSRPCQAVPRRTVVLLRRDAAHPAHEAGETRAGARALEVAGAPATPGEGSRAAREARAGLSNRRQARAVQRRLLPGAVAAECRTGDGPHRTHRAGGRAFKDRAAAIPPTSSFTRRASRARTSWRRCRSPVAAGST